jgi:putative DNA primase/helicase
MIPLAALEKEADRAFTEAALRAEVDKIEHDARRKAAKAKMEKAIENKSAEEIDSAKEYLLSLEREISSPRCKRFKTNDTTIAKLTELLAENPRGLLVFRDELIGFLVTLEQEGREDSRAFYIEAWTGWSSSGIKTDRITRGTTSCNPCISILGGIQPSKLRLYLQSTLANIGNDGFIQRFQLLVFPDRPKKWKLVDRRPDDKAREQVKNIGAFLAATDFISIGAHKEESFPLPFFRFSLEAQEFFYGWYSILEERLIKEYDDGLITEHLAKYRSLMPSLALIGYLTRILSGALIGEGVALEDAKRAVDLCAYLETHARRVYAMIEHRGVYAAKALLKKIREGAIGDKFTQREVYRKGWSGLDSKGVEDACIELISRGWLKEEVVSPALKGGATGFKYRLHPSLQKISEPGTDNTDN